MSAHAPKPAVPDSESIPPLRRVKQGIARFAEEEASGAIVMLFAAVVALIIANSPLYGRFDAFWHMEFGFVFGPFHFEESTLHWVNDGLMAIFFLVVGLEIKREFLVGELSDRRKAILPILAAVGGMVLPAAIYIAVAAFGGAESIKGWGVPMATDIAFALGVLALLGSRIPSGLKVFLTALAIADDIGAILVIAIFYSHGFSIWWFVGAMVCLGVLIALNVLKVDSPWWYLFVGAFMWFAMLESGVHATIAGVLLAFTIPATARISAPTFIEYTRRQLADIEESHDPDAHVLETDDDQNAAYAIREAARRTAAPLQRLENALHPFSSFVVLPLFALANAGVRIIGIEGLGATGPVTVMAGIALGLALGKPLGIVAFSWLAVKMGWSPLPTGCGWKQVIGAGVLGGIGFTMSLFVANLAFEDYALLSAAKVAILATSVVVGIVGYLWLRAVSCPVPELAEE